MSKKKRDKRIFGIGEKISLFLILVLTICILTGTVVQYHFTIQELGQNERESAQINIKHIASYMDVKIKNITERLFYIRLNPAFSTAVEKLLLDQIDEVPLSVKDGIISTLMLYRVSESLMLPVYFYTPVFSCSDDSVLIKDGFVFEQTEFYEAFTSSNDAVLWSAPCVDPIFVTGKTVIPVIHKWTISGYAKPLALIGNIDQRRLQQYLSKTSLPEYASVLILDEAGNEIVSQIQEEDSSFIFNEFNTEKRLQICKAEQEFVSLETLQGEYWINHSSLETAPWHILYIRSKENVYEKMSDYSKSLVYLNIGVFIAVLFFVISICKKMTKPLYKLSEAMAVAGEQKYKVDFVYTKNDEIGMLTNSFNHMNTYTRELLQQKNNSIKQLQEEKERVRIEQLLKRRAELKALQAQINPHFLYNTLDSIRWKAEEIEAEEISQMTQALAMVFRIGLSKGQEMISVRDELCHVKSYLEIQCIRYGKRLTYSIDVEERILECYMVKLLLQPLVENAIYHGIKEKDNDGHVRICGGLCGEIIFFYVEDNGIGIQEEKVKELNLGLKNNLSVSKQGYGIFNVNERIKLYYGDSYGLDLESTWGKGTKSIITIPKITEEEVEDYVPYFDCR